MPPRDAQLRWSRNRVPEQQAQRTGASALDGAVGDGADDFEAPNVEGVGVASIAEARVMTVGGLIAREEGDEEEDATAHADVLAGVIFLSPSAVLILLPYALVVETPVLISTLFKTPGSPGSQDLGTWLIVPLVACVGGIMAFALIFVEMQLVKATSSLAVSVIGNVKDAIQGAWCWSISVFLFFSLFFICAHTVGTTVPLSRCYSFLLLSALITCCWFFSALPHHTSLSRDHHRFSVHLARCQGERLYSVCVPFSLL